MDGEHHISVKLFIPICRSDGRNTELEAIRALQYEGSPAEIAQGFKEQGNEMVKLKRWKDGQEFYTKGIIVLSQQKRERINFSKGADGAILEIEEEIELQEETRLNEVCHVNRALCNLELSRAIQIPGYICGRPDDCLCRKLQVHDS